MKNAKVAMISSVLPFFLLAGCASNSTQSQAKPAKQEAKVATAEQSSIYLGENNQKKLETAAKSQAKSADAQIEAAKSAYVNRDYKTSISYYEQAIKIDPKNAIALNNLGNVMFRGLNKPKDAIQYYQKAIKVNPSYSFGWVNLALAQKAIGQKKEAQATITNALKYITKKDPNYNQLISAGKN
jgi:Tfp pilus assembly protein PilF